MKKIEMIEQYIRQRLLKIEIITHTELPLVKEISVESEGIIRIQEMLEVKAR